MGSLKNEHEVSREITRGFLSCTVLQFCVWIGLSKLSDTYEWASLTFTLISWRQIIYVVPFLAIAGIKGASRWYIAGALLACLIVFILGIGNLLVGLCGAVIETPK